MSYPLWRSKEYMVRLSLSTKREEIYRRALEEIAKGTWTESKDILGAAYSELRAISKARTALDEGKEVK